MWSDKDGHIQWSDKEHIEFMRRHEIRCGDTKLENEWIHRLVRIIDELNG